MDHNRKFLTKGSIDFSSAGNSRVTQSHLHKYYSTSIPFQWISCDENDVSYRLVWSSQQASVHVTNKTSEWLDTCVLKSVIQSNPLDQIADDKCALRDLGKPYSQWPTGITLRYLIQGDRNSCLHNTNSRLRPIQCQLTTRGCECPPSVSRHSNLSVILRYLPQIWWQITTNSTWNRWFLS